MKRYSAVLALLIALLPLAAQAQVYGVSLNGFNSGNPGPSSLYEIDPVTGAGTLIGDIGFPVNAIAVDPTTGTLYGSTTQWEEPYIGQLLIIDPVSGAGTPVGDTGITFCCRALTFDSAGQLWGWSEDTDDPVTIDKTTGAATVVGESGINTGGQVMAFDLTDTLYLVQNSSVYIIDQVTGAGSSQGSLSFDPGAGGAAFDPSGTLWAPRNSAQTQDSFIRLTDIAGDSFVDLDTDVEYLNAVTAGDTDVLAGLARFRVTKTFSDGSDDEVQVTLTCNSGLPLEQSFTIEGGGEGVLFVVEEIPESGADCEVTESGGPAGYTAVFNNGNGCAWEDVVGGLRICNITNEANPAEYTVTKDWVVTGAVGEGVIEAAFVDIDCDSDILSVDGSPIIDPTDEYRAYLEGDGDSVTVEVDTSAGPTECSAVEDVNQSGIETDYSPGCSNATLTAGGSGSCTITNTVFFEGIPTLSQWGMALMALLMLGVGFIGLRRIV